jgi:hypothetical protein
LCEHGIEFVDPRFFCVVVRQSGRSLYLADDRMKTSCSCVVAEQK